MLDGLLTFVLEVLFEWVCYAIGRWLLLAISFGRFDPRQRNSNEGLVALLCLARRSR